MKVLLINGSPHIKGTTFTALEKVSDSLAQEEIDAEIMHIGLDPKPCIACGKCHATGRCIYNDSVNKVIESADEYQGLIVGSPVYYAGPSGGVLCFMDRLFQAGHEKYPIVN